MLFQVLSTLSFVFPQLHSEKKILFAGSKIKVLVTNFSFKNQYKEATFGAAMTIFLLMNKIKYKHSGYLYTYHYHGKTMINELNAGHVPSFVWLPNVSSQLYITFCCLFLLEKKCTQLKKCSLVLCSIFKTNLSFLILSRRLTDRHIIMLLTPGHSHVAFLVPVPWHTCYGLGAHTTWLKILFTLGKVHLIWQGGMKIEGGGALKKLLG